MTTVMAQAIAWPRLATCQRCGQPVLKARHRGSGRPVVLEPREIMPVGRCDRCHGNGSCRVEIHQGVGIKTTALRRSVEPGDLVGYTTIVREVCPSCHGVGTIGEPIPADVVTVDALHGIAHHRLPQQTWEAAHRRHRCP